jgi:hypothetical protein
MPKMVNDFIAALPPCLEAEFLLAAPDEAIRLAVGPVEMYRGGRLLGGFEGILALEWLPRLRITCTGDSDLGFAELHDGRPFDLHVPQIDLSAEAFVTSVRMGRPSQIQALLMRSVNPRLGDSDHFRFYLVNFPSVLGDPVRRGSGPLAGFGRDRLQITVGSLVCTIDRIGRTRESDGHTGRPGYMLTHVAEVRRPGQPLSPEEIHDLLDVLYWLCAFMRGARTGPILPSVDSPFAKHWISVAPWIVDEARDVDTWLPDRSPVDVDSLLKGFIHKFADPVWNEGLRTTLSWYITANAPATPSEARILLCQIALDVLASLSGLEDGVAHERIRRLLVGLRIPTDVPARLEAWTSKVGWTPEVTGR